jgi:hypothetical protein
MYKQITTTITLAAGLFIAPLPLLIHDASGQVKPSTSAKNTPAKTTSSASQTALRERQKKCSVEWKEAKKAGKVEKEMKWPQYWSACNKRLKANG